MGKAGDLKEGFRQAQDIINSGQPITKLREWVTAQNSSPEAGLSKLEGLLKESAAN
jgi:anthranilate phosphoribosyltransferase